MLHFTVSEIYMESNENQKKPLQWCRVKQETIFTLTNDAKNIPLFTAKQECINVLITCFLSTDKHT